MQEKSLRTLDLTMISWICHQKHRQQKSKTDKWDYIKTLKFLCNKGNNRVKWQPIYRKAKDIYKLYI